MEVGGPVYKVQWIYRGFIPIIGLAVAAAALLIEFARYPSVNSAALFGVTVFLLAMYVSYSSWFDFQVSATEQGVCARSITGRRVLLWNEIVAVHEYRAAFSRILTLFTGDRKGTVTLLSAGQGYDDIRSLIRDKRPDLVAEGPRRLERLGYMGRSPRLRGVKID